MIELPTEKKWSGDGWGQDPRLLFQVKRSAKNAIYRVTSFKTGATTGYEVFKIKVQPKGHVCFDKVSEDDEEKYPTAEQFGKTAWTAGHLERAEQIFEALEQGKHPHGGDEVESSSAEPDTSEPTAPRGRGRPKVERPPLLLPVVEFSCKELAEQNHVDYAVAFVFLKEQEGAGIVKRTRQERRAAKGKPTQLFQKTA